MNRKTTPRPPFIKLAIATLGVDLGAGNVPADIRLIPAGEFRSWDGRPSECAAWVMLDEDGARLVAEAAARTSARVIDYEHATLQAKKTGSKAPAAGWFKNLEWRSGDGLYAIGVDWTALAAQEIGDKTYRFISPVFSYDAKTGRVDRLLHAALTNDPGLDGLTDLAALAAEFFPDQSLEVSMNEELLEQLRWMLNLPVGSTAEEIVTHLDKLIAQLKTIGGTAAAAASFDLPAHLATLSAQVAAPDPTRFVPIATLSALQGEHADLQNKLAALSTEVSGGKLDKVIEDGKAAGKITPALEPWAREHGNKDLASLSAWIAAAPVSVKPGETQTGGKPAVDELDLNDAAAVALSAQLYQSEMSGKGVNITTVQAVAHVSKKGA